MSRFLIGEIPVDFLSEQEIQTNIAEFFSSNRLKKNQTPAHIVTINSLMMNHTYKDSELLNAIKNADLIIPDSIGIITAGFLLGAKKSNARLIRMPGIDLMLKICDYAQEVGLSVFLLGAKPDTIPETALKLKKLFPELRIAGFYHGYFDENAEKYVFKEIKKSNPDIIFVGLNVPRQEKWIHKNLSKFSSKIVMGVGGSFDVISGKLKRAPFFMRLAGLEWLFRFLQEPWRIVRIKDLPVFFVRILKLSLRGA
ncbi:MAG: WecB/TagA/CpsF family glycosyltransferase [Elusimicrobiota bacterium]